MVGLALGLAASEAAWLDLGPSAFVAAAFVLALMLRPGSVDRRFWWQLLRLGVLIALGLCAVALGAGMQPRWGRLPVVVALQLGTCVPLVYSMRQLRHWGLKLLVLVLGLPLLMLSMAVHRLPATLPGGWNLLGGRGQVFGVLGEDGVRVSATAFEPAVPRGMVVLVHGVGAEQYQFAGLVAGLHRRGFSVYTYDQRCHGASQGWSSTLGSREAADLQRVWAAALQRHGPASGPRLLYGVSMGGAAAQLAAPHLPGLDGLVLHSSFASLPEVAAARIPLLGVSLVTLLETMCLDWYLSGRRFLGMLPAQRAGRCQGLPVLVLHDRGDPVIDSAQALALQAAWQADLRMGDGEEHVPGAGHGWVARALMDFVARL